MISWTLLRFGLVLWLLSSCAHHPVSPTSAPPQPPPSSTSSPETSGNEDSSFTPSDLPPELQREELNALNQQLNELTNKLKEKGPQVLSYLANDLYLKASRASLKGDALTATVLFRHIHQLAPDDLYLQKRLAIELIRQGQLNEAQELLEAKGKGLPFDTERALLLAGIHTALLNRNTAQQLYRTVLKEDPKNQDACVFLSKSYVEANQVERAIALLRTCEKQSAAAAYPFYLGKIFSEQQREREAIGEFERALRYDPNYLFALLELSKIYEKRQTPAPLLKLYERYLQLNPTDPLILNKIVQLLIQEGDQNRVLAYLEVLTEVVPDDLNARAKLAIIYGDQKNYEAAIRIFKEILQEMPGADKIKYYLASLYQERGEWDEAVHYFLQIREEESLFYEAQIQVANLLLTMTIQGEKKGGRSLASVASAASVAPNGRDNFLNFVDHRSSKGPSNPKLTVQLQILKATLFEYEQNVEGSIGVLESIRHLKEFSGEHQYYLATLYERKKDYKQAYQIISEILERDPKNAQAWNFLGYSLLDRETMLDKAFQYIQKALSLDPNDGYIRDSLGWYYFKRGNLTRALKEILFAHEQEPDDVVIAKHLALIYSQLGQRKRATHYYQKAIQNASDQGEKQELEREFADWSQTRSAATHQ